jgi:hypothetical protein
MPKGIVFHEPNGCKLMAVFVIAFLRLCISTHPKHMVYTKPADYIYHRTQAFSGKGKKL